ncbi:Tat proofreading chaperone FdhE [Bisgaardia hudsonensis]|uniref:Protein FdhE homolog n=1 Tax=Bisgaardia hudsonensis TaxID=109472 RepID=A0A4R2N124_9PAST|nr:formate dehydrogenase accessory protein FdhE [Bisgaardia hudsonensis]QLB13205.1 formate dehydrogenase accessory protein FdhE [Bisgaardia hudsonensis]TCP13218.1 Tat proofreading chaperone FdhE [Bisgaardia hudsonensis]
MSIKILPKEQIQQNANNPYSPPLLFGNSKKIYQRRIERLQKLAVNHPMADYLLFVSKIVESQLSIMNRADSFDIVLPEQLSDIMPLHVSSWKRDQHWQQILMMLLSDVKLEANEVILATIDWLEKSSSSELERLADQLLKQEISSVGTDKAIFIWAALSVYWQLLTQKISHNAIMENSDNLHICPVCGSAPVSSVIQIGATQGLRYLHCSLCETEWNMVRSKCSNCEQTGQLDYWSIDSEFSAIKAESCGDCHTYLKAFYQEKDADIDAIADDLASIFLDIEMEEKGFARSGVNPFLFSSEEQ